MAIDNEPKIFHPKKMILWIALGSITMMFVAFTSAYLVRRAAGNWVEFRLPDIFFFNTILIMFSSWTMHQSSLALKKNNYNSFKTFLGITTLLGVVFIILQYIGWKALGNIGIHLTGNPSGSFVYVISGVHAMHVVGGVLFLLYLFLHATVNLSDPVKKLIYETNPINKLNINLMATYWHFVDGLWVYLFLFFYISQS